MSARMDGQDYTRCRILGHAWFDVDSDWEPFAGTPLTVRCERCMTERRDSVSNSTGELIGRHYVYAIGYQLKKNDPRPTKNDYRLILLQKRLEEARSNRRAAKKAAK